MKKWDYHTIHIQDNTIVKKSHLVELGEQGWELVNVLALFHANIYYFKREKIEKVEAPEGD